MFVNLANLVRSLILPLLICRPVPIVRMSKCRLVVQILPITTAPLSAQTHNTHSAASACIPLLDSGAVFDISWWIGVSSSSSKSPLAREVWLGIIVTTQRTVGFRHSLYCLQYNSAQCEYCITTLH